MKKGNKMKVGCYPGGGQVLGNIGKSILDAPLSALGLSNIIPDDAYKGSSAQGFAEAANTIGTVGNMALPFIPGVGTALSIGSQVAGQFNPQNSQKPMYPMGGMSMYPNAEVEKEENTINPDGTTNQYDGPTHEDGGIPTSLDPTTLIFSDRLKMPKTKKTFADLNKKNNTDKEQKVLDNKKVGNIQKATAELMKMAKNKNSINLYKEQEALKQSKVDAYAKRLGIDTGSYKYGGMKQYPHGGEYGPKNYGEGYGDVGVMQMGYYPNAYNQALAKLGNAPYPQGIIGPEKTSLASMPENDPSDAFKASIGAPRQIAGTTPSSQSRSGPDWGNIGTQAGLGLAANVGNIYDLYRSYQPVQKTSFNRVTPDKVNPSATIANNNQIFAKGAENVRDASVGNSSTYIQNRKDLAINQMLANAKVRQDYDNQNAQIANQANYYNAQIGDRENLTNMQSEAQARNIRSNAFSSLGHNIYNQGANVIRDNNTAQRDQDYLKILTQQFPEILRSNPDLINSFIKK